MYFYHPQGRTMTRRSMKMTTKGSGRRMLKESMRMFPATQVGYVHTFFIVYLKNFELFDWKNGPLLSTEVDDGEFRIKLYFSNLKGRSVRNERQVREVLQNLKVAALRAELTVRGLSSTGTKDELIERLLQYFLYSGESKSNFAGYIFNIHLFHFSILH